MRKRTLAIWRIIASFIVIVLSVSECNSVVFAVNMQFDCANEEVNVIIDETVACADIEEDDTAGVVSEEEDGANKNVRDDVESTKDKNENFEESINKFLEDDKDDVDEEIEETVVLEEQIVEESLDGISPYDDDEGTCGEEVYYTYSSNGGVLRIFGQGSIWNFVSPAECPWYRYRTNIYEIEIGEEITGIGDYAFSGCRNITGIKIPDSIEFMGFKAFEGCYGIKNVYTDSLESWLKITFDDQGYLESNPISFSRNLIVKGEPLVDVDMPYGITNINDYAFANCDTIKYVAIWEKNTSIGECAFLGCENLEKVLFFTDNMEKIGSMAFAGCNKLRRIRIPGNVRIMGAYVFAGRTERLSIYGYGSGEYWDPNWSHSFNPENDVDIYNHLSGYFTEEEVQYWNDLDRTQEKIIIRDGITKIPDFEFLDCLELKSIVLPDSVKSIGAAAFAGCENLEKVVLSKNLETIDGDAFSSCKSLKGIFIPASVKWVGSQVFARSSGKLIIYCESEDTNNRWMYDWNCDSNGYGSSKSYPVNWNCSEEEAQYWIDLDKTKANITIRDGITRIPDNAFDECSNLKSIVLPDSVTSIGRGAFRHCYNLTDITFSSNIDYIGDEAFLCCDNMDNVCIESVEDWLNIRFEAVESNPLFYGPNLMIDGEILTDLVIPDSVIEINEFAFHHYKALESVKTHSLFKSIGNASFYGCENLNEIDLAEGLQSIGTLAFASCTSLQSVYIPGSVTDIKSGPFMESNPDLIICCGADSKPSGWNTDWHAYNNRYFGGKEIYLDNINWGCNDVNAIYWATLDKQQENIVIPEGITYIPDNAFAGCFNLKNVVIPSTVTRIGDYAFYNCGLSSIDIPGNVETIGEHAFNGCTGISSIILGSGIESIGEFAFRDCSEISSLVIPNTVTSIGQYAFNGCEKLESVNIPGSLKVIEEGVFYCCPELRNVEFGEGIETISFGAFAGDYSLSRLIFPDSLKEIDKAFWSCPDLHIVYIPRGVTTVVAKAFETCSSLKVYCQVSEKPELWSDTWDCYDENPNNRINVYWNASDKDKYWITLDYSQENIVIPDGIISIPDRAFEGCGSLVSISIPDSVKNIGAYAFKECVNLKEVCITGNVSELAEGTFFNCLALKRITLGKGIKKIGQDCFYGCGSLSSIILPDTVESIGANAFGHCLSIKSIYIPDNVAIIEGALFTDSYNGIKVLCQRSEKPEGWSDDWNIYWLVEREDTYWNMSMLDMFWYAIDDEQTELVIPDGVEIIPDGAVKDKYNITNISIPNTVTKIGKEAFSGCTGLKSINIPSGLKEIGEFAFSGCWNLESVYIEDIESWLQITFEEFQANPLSERGVTLYVDGEPLTDLVVPKGTKVINEYAFSYYEMLKTVTISNSVQVIKSHAFNNCENLNEIYIPSSVISIMDEAFSGSNEDLIIKCQVSEGQPGWSLNWNTYWGPQGISHYKVIYNCLPPVVEEEIQEGLWISGIDKLGYEYTGKAIRPEVSIYDGNTLLVSGVDYTISYINNVNAASSDAKIAPTIRVKGKGNYSGTIEEKFSINKKDISDIDVTADDIFVSYNKRTQKLVPVVMYSGKKLVNKRDFTLEYVVNLEGDFVNAGSYYIKVIGLGNYTGIRWITETITSDMLMSKATVEITKSMPYTGEAVTPSSLVVKYAGQVLSPGEHYNVTYRNNLEIGTAEAIITGTGKQTLMGTFVGTKQINFTITGTSIAKAKVLLDSPVVYTGEEIIQYPDVVVNNVTLEENRDYTVAITNNTKIGTASVVITGIGQYTGVVKKSFKIVGYDISSDADNAIDIDMDSEYPFAAGGVKPKPEVSFNGQVLIEGKDYSLAYANNTAVNDGTNLKKQPTVTIKGKGNFKGTIKETDWTIAPQELDNLQLNVADKGYSTKSSGWKSVPTVTDLDGKNLKSGKDYNKEVEYTYFNDTELANGIIRGAGESVENTDILPVGTEIKVTLTAKDGGNYIGEISDTYVITEKSIDKARISVLSQVYTGKEITLESKDFKATVDGNEMVLGRDYVIVGYTNNIKKGTAYVTIKGIGSYGGTKNIKFSITSRIMKWFGF